MKILRKVGEREVLNRIFYVHNTIKANNTLNIGDFLLIDFFSFCIIVNSGLFF